MERGLEREAAWVLVAVCDKIVIPDEKYSAIVKVMYLPYVYKVVSVSLSCMAKREALNRIQLFFESLAPRSVGRGIKFQPYQRIHVIHQAENAFAEICSQFIHHALI